MVTTFEIERGRIFVGGLHWQALSGSAAECRAEAHALAKQLSFDLAVWRTTGAQQVGFAATRDGYKPGMLSAAAVVSKTIEVEFGERDFLCATELPDGRFLYVSQSEGVILAEGDLIGSEEDVRARMLEDLSVGKTWGMLFAPLMWGLPEAEERNFLQFLPSKGGKLDLKHSWWALKPIKPSIGGLLKAVMPFVLIGLVVAGGMIGYKKWQQVQAEKEAARLAAQQANQSTPERPHPWKMLPRAVPAVKACLEATGQVGTWWPGNWKPDSVICSMGGSSIVVRWLRGEHGWIKHLLTVEPKAVVATDGSGATLATSFNPGAGEDEALTDERARLLHLQILAQEYGLTLSVGGSEAPPQMPGAQTTTQAPPAWREVPWAIKEASFAPTDVIAAMDGPGFRVKGVTARFREGLIKWDVEGTQYVLP